MMWNLENISPPIFNTKQLLVSKALEFNANQALMFSVKCSTPELCPQALMFGPVFIKTGECYPMLCSDEFFRVSKFCDH